jgi:tryptophanyl-tRNA synthetase
MTKNRVMSGMRTTERLHMGNYFGALKNWITLQETSECFFGAMNWHSMTDGFKTPDIFTKHTRDIIIDWLAMGIDPTKCTIFIQSEVPGLLELNMLLTVITPMGWLDRVTTWKDAEEELKQKDAHNLGRLSYPVLQTADILIFKGEKVPVGKDQVPHLELAREIVRRFNFLYKSKLPEPQALLTETPMLMGLDGRKMSKSYGNVLPLIDEPQNIEKICKSMVTDPARVRRTDPGNPEVCPVFSFHKLFTDQAEKAQIDVDCRSAAIGCMDCKLKLAKNINSFLKEPLEKRKELLNNPSQLDAIIDDGCQKASKVAEATMLEVRSALGWQKG